MSKYIFGELIKQITNLLKLCYDLLELCYDLLEPQLSGKRLN